MQLLLPLPDISLTLDTFGGEATCSSPDVVAVSSVNSACFMAFRLITSFVAAFFFLSLCLLRCYTFLATCFDAAFFFTFPDISLTLDILGGEVTCSSPDVVPGSSANSACFVAFCLTTSFGAAFFPFQMAI